MNTGRIAFLCGILVPFAAIASNEGVPSYYQTNNTTTVNQAAYGKYASQGYTQYVGQSGNKQIVGSQTTSYQVPRQTVPTIAGTMTANGIAMPVENNTTLWAGYTRRFADFEFKTGVNSVLEWDDMVFDEIGVGLQHNFSIRSFDMFATAEYSMGFMSHGGMSMDYDLEPYDASKPYDGIFTISVGDQTGRTNHLKVAIGAHHVWDIGGWKLSPSFGYEIFNHNLEMSDHYYPNPGIFLPLMTSNGDYVYGDLNGTYYSVPINVTPPEDWYQVCMSPEDIKLVQTTASGGIWEIGTSLVTGDYDPNMGYIPWGVDAGECVVIGGDGPVIVEGTTHIYNTTWSGFYIGLEIEKQMTLADKLRFYFQVGLPQYSSEGTWPNRTDWQQNPSFIDEGSNGSYSYAAEMEYNYRISDRMQLAIKVDTNLFHVGKIGGELYLAEYTQWLVDENGYYILDDNGLPILETVPPETVYISDQLERATWQSFGLHIGLKYSF
ncbi:MAG TPA: hypothetical protein IAD02_00925 [Candidatus Enterousia intestinigallinarum]|uniref:Protochlamydia outer membrane protein domain-containing protein n=1 Tax=Candidatus Enterousia intestinigallinarum TaxID=2840790 RepID=A0A9D1JW32_9PROT|nr:hypothetical protein [Candidatus Enterousia intestinigallinarum]